MMSENTHLKRYIGGGLLLLSLSLGLMAVLMLLMGDDNTAPEIVDNEPTVAPTQTHTPGPTATFTRTPRPSATPSPSPTNTLPPSVTPFPTVDAVLVGTQASAPLDTSSGGEIVRSANAYTIGDDRNRTDVIQYTVQYGDHIRDIAAHFGIDMNTIIWSNKRFYVNAMRPGMQLNILPFDGALHTVEEPTTVRELADEYEVDPSVIILSDLNELSDTSADAMLPVGLAVVIPGGTGSKEPIYWEPPGGAAIETAADGTFGQTGVVLGHARFGDGQQGSCGMQPIYGGTGLTTGPVYGYKLTNGFSWNHRGVDLSAGEGTPVKAAGGGTVIFTGWSDWGYGYSVVIAHGSVMTLYAHMTGTPYTWCGKVVEAGEVIGFVGSTGNSSGPHLHFEVRNAAGVPVDPNGYISF